MDTHWFHRWFNEDYLNLYAYRDPAEAVVQSAFIIKALDLQGDEKILDLGCGTGRHVIEFAKRGFNVTGIDVSAYLIEQGKKVLQDSDLDATLIVADMFDLPDLGLFDVVLNVFTSFGYFPQDEQNARVFDAVRSHLRPDGKFFLDYLHPAQVIRNLIPFEVKEVGEERVEITKRIEGGRILKTIVFSHPKREYVEKVKLYTRSQIEEMLSAHSLQVQEVWNDYDGSPWRDDGDRQLFFVIPRADP